MTTGASVNLSYIDARLRRLTLDEIAAVTRAAEAAVVEFDAFRYRPTEENVDTYRDAMNELRRLLGMGDDPHSAAVSSAENREGG